MEKGCISCRFYKDIERKNRFSFLQEWQSLADFKSHIQTKNYRYLLTVMELLNEPPEIKINFVSQTAGMELIEAAMGRDM